MLYHLLPQLCKYYIYNYLFYSYLTSKLSNIVAYIMKIVEENFTLEEKEISTPQLP